MYNRDHPEYIYKQNYKKKIFNKIINWFILFDDYISYVNNNSSLNDTKSFLDEYSKSLNSENKELDLESQSILLFRVNLQKYDFLKAKFCLACGNYIDALFYFIRSSKKSDIVIDGLIKKKSLKHIYKLLLIMNTKFNDLSLKNLYIEKKLKEYFEDKNKSYSKKLKIGRKVINRSRKSNSTNATTFGEEIEKIKNNILSDFDECNEKKEKDIIIIIDLNIYSNSGEDNLYSKNYKIDLFIEQTQIILNTYLSNNDRFCVIIYTNDYKVICPLMKVNKIDKNSFSKDLIYYKNLVLNENNETEEFDIISNELNETNNNLDFTIGKNNINKLSSNEDSLEISEREEINYDKINAFVKTINYANNYSKMKEEEKNEKYIIVFTDIINLNFTDKEQVEKNMENLIRDKEIIFLLVGKIKNNKLSNEKSYNISEENNSEKLILSKFGEKSEIIDFENMKKIKTILSNNAVIKDEIIFPNEIYK